MDERGLWELFWKTGRPEVWLAMAGLRLEEQARWEEPAKMAFQPRVKQV